MNRHHAAVLVALLLVAWPFWLFACAGRAAAANGAAMTAAIAATYYAGSLVCHQNPDRSFHLGAVQIAVCARCLGLYAGAAAGGFAGLLWWRAARRSAGAYAARLRRTRWLLAGAALPTAASFLLEHGAGAGIGNLERFAGALPLGAAVAAVATAWMAGVAFDASLPGTAVD